MEWKDYNRWVAGLAIDRYLMYQSKGIDDAREKALEWISRINLDPLSYAKYSMLGEMFERRIDGYLALINKSKVRFSKYVLAAIASLLASAAIFILWG